MNPTCLVAPALLAATVIAGLAIVSSVASKPVTSVESVVMLRLSERVSETSVASPEPRIAVLSLLSGPAIPDLIEQLRALGDAGPTEADYVALQQAGLAVRGTVTGELMLTPVGRRRAAGIASEVASKTGAHRPTVGIRNRMAYFACPCGKDMRIPIGEPAAYAQCRAAYDAHCRRMQRQVHQYPNSKASPEDAAAMMADHMRRYQAGMAAWMGRVVSADKRGDGHV